MNNKENWQQRFVRKNPIIWGLIKCLAYGTGVWYAVVLLRLAGAI